MKTYPRLSASRINACKPQSHDVWLSDAGGWRGHGQLLLRISPSGSRHFYFRCTDSGRRTTIKLGRYSRNRSHGFLTLSEARALANRYALSKAHLAAGRCDASLPIGDVTAPDLFADSSGHRLSQTHSSPRESDASQETAAGLTVNELCDRYIEWLESRKKPSARDMFYIARQVAKSDLGTRPARDVTSQEFSMMLRSVVERGAGRTAVKVRSMLHAAYACALNAELNPLAVASSIDASIKSNPIAAIPSMTELNSARERSLTKDELKEFWQRVCRPGDNAESIALAPIRLALLLGGQRFRQLCSVPVARVDLDAETILLMDPKGKRLRPRAHLLPLCPLAKGEVVRLIERNKALKSIYLMPGREPNMFVSKQTISKFVKNTSIDMLASGHSKQGFQLLDLRRTVETTMASMGVHKDIRAQIQSHGISGTQDKHYDRYDYMREKRQTLAMWEGFLTRLLEE